MSQLVYDTAVVHFNWLFNGREDALRCLSAWVCRPSSQFTGLHATLALEGDTAVGAFLAMPGEELNARQKADFLALVKATKGRDRADLQARLEQLKRMETLADSGDFYIRTIAVVAHRRGLGLGSRVLQECLEVGSRSGFRRFRLDVRADNLPALRLYASFGFRTILEVPVAYPGRAITIASMVADIK
ncbi:MAG: GNAT family N-acetyltransferase [Nitrospira sp.]|nr:GNAT family N-acetyltransferase [Nitrospira sp.]